MRPWASWTAKTAVFSLAAGLAATAAGSAAWAAAGSGAGVALAAVGSAASAARGGGPALAARGGGPALAARGGAIGSGQVTAQTALAGDVCRDAGALLGIVGAACQSVTLVASPASALAQAGQPAAGTGRAAAGQGTSQGASQGSGQGTSQGASQGSGQGASQGASQGSGQGSGRASGQGTSGQGGSGIRPELEPGPRRDRRPGDPARGGAGHRRARRGRPGAGAPSSLDAGADGASAPGTARTSARPPAARAGDTNVPAATQLAGLGALPGLVDLPSAGPASTPARNGAPGGGIPMPGTALSAASSGVGVGHGRRGDGRRDARAAGHWRGLRLG